jgi:hypothetical protein
MHISAAPSSKTYANARVVSNACWRKNSDKPGNSTVLMSDIVRPFFASPRRHRLFHFCALANVESHVNHTKSNPEPVDDEVFDKSQRNGVIGKEKNVTPVT